MRSRWIGYVVLVIVVTSLIGAIPSTAGASPGASTGVAWAWGDNTDGKLGNNSTTNSPVPVAVQMPSGVTFAVISAGGNHNLALDPSGHAWAWGSNGNGELGDNSTANSPVPVAVQMPAGVIFSAISAGGDHNLALDTSGRTWAWGDNSAGELGVKSTTNSLVPVAVQVPNGVTFRAISAGSGFSLALDTSGHAWGWGFDGPSDLGNGGGSDVGTGEANCTPCSIVPVAAQMPSGVTFQAISAGGQHSLALDTNGDAWGWGNDFAGQVGNPSVTGDCPGGGFFGPCGLVPVPVAMPEGVTFSAISAGGFFSLGLDTSGHVWAWGINDQGELGNPSVTTGCGPGSIPCSQVPVAVQLPIGVTVSAISAGGGEFSQVLDTSGHAWGWGNNASGELGDNSTTTTSVPMAVQMPSGLTFSTVTAGGSQSLALQATAVTSAVTVTNVSTQYSDAVTLKATVGPASIGGSPRTGTVQFSVNGANVGSPVAIDATGAASLPIRSEQLGAGTYAVGASFTSTNPLFANGSGTGTLTVRPEDAAFFSAGINPSIVEVNAAGGTAGPITLAARLTEAADDATVGDIAKAAPVLYTLTPVGPGPSYTCAAASGMVRRASLVTTCTFPSVVVNVYLVQVHLEQGNRFYQAPSGIGSLTVDDPSLGFTAGGGLIDPDGVLAQFGFLARKLESGQIQGELLFLEERPLGDVILRSTTLSALAIVNGKIVDVQGTATLGRVSNYRFHATAIDNDRLGATDQFGLALTNPNGTTNPPLTFAPVTIIRGDIIVHH
jgi:alpha-tubulin suppressor-like RCC1 family protein